MRYLELTVECGRPAAEAVTDLLTAAAGGAAVYDPLDIVTARGQGRWDLDDFPPADPQWVRVQAYLPDTPDLAARVEDLQLGLASIESVTASGTGLTTAWVDEEDWANAWKEYFKPLPMGRRLVIMPAWEPVNRPAGDSHRLPLVLDPGMAFGTGQHATTALCLEWLEELVPMGKPVLDVGTGSGILAIAAALLGAGPVLGLDIDPVAVAAAQQNIGLNSLQQRVQVLQGELGSPPVQRWLTTQAPDLVVANLVAGLIVQLAPQLAAALPNGGQLLASGIITERQDEVMAALSDHGLIHQGARESGGWLALLAVKA